MKPSKMLLMNSIDYGSSKTGFGRNFRRPEGIVSFLSVVVLSFAVGVAAMGCARTPKAQAVVANPSGFLPDYTLLKPGAPEESLLGYHNPKADWPSYPKILIDPVLIWSRTDALPDPTPQKDLRRLADNFYQMIRNELGKDYDIVKEPEPRALRLQVALTNIEQATGAVHVTTAVVPEGHTISGGKDFVTGKPLLAGSVNAEYKIIDARTGQILAMGMDRDIGRKRIEKHLDGWDDANRILALYARLVRYKLCRFRGGTECANPAE